jgi:hypothetical protein
MNDDSFLSRWSRRKAAARQGQPLAPEPAPLVPADPPVRAAQPPAEPAPAAEPLPTLADAALLRPGDSIARFVARGVDETVKRAALKTLFADPHFHVMDGLDTYIDDYGKPDPIPLDVLRRMRQSETLGLFAPTDDELAAASAAQQATQQAVEAPGAPVQAAPRATADQPAALESPDAVPPAMQPHASVAAGHELPGAARQSDDSAPGKHA